MSWRYNVPINAITLRRNHREIVIYEKNGKKKKT